MPKYHFLEYGARELRSPRAPFVVLPIPLERSVSFGHGTAKAPAAILAASTQMELFDEEFFSPPGFKVQTLPAVNCSSGSTAAILNRINRVAGKVLKNKKILISFGGEHTITVPLVAAAKSVGKDISVLNLDSHLDLRDIYRNNRFSHACVFRRVMEINVPVTHVGIRSLCQEEYDLVQRRHLNVYWAREILAAKNDAWMDALVAGLKDKVYISIDADVLDPAIMPGTGTPEPGGLSWATVLRLLRRVSLKRTVIAADVVEVVPLPRAPLCEYTAAKLAFKLMTYCSKSAAINERT